MKLLGVLSDSTTKRETENAFSKSENVELTRLMSISSSSRYAMLKGAGLMVQNSLFAQLLVLQKSRLENSKHQLETSSLRY